MASASKDQNGWRIRFYETHGTRRLTIRPGVTSKAQAESIARHIGHLRSAKLSGESIEPNTARWLATIGDALHTKLANAGLVEQRQQKNVATLEKLVDAFIELGQTKTGKPASVNTIKKWGAAKLHLLSYFAARTPVGSITAEQAHQFSQWLQSPQGADLALNTARKVIANAKLFFLYAERLRYIPKNESPFHDVVSSTMPNRSKDHFIRPEDYKALLAACPSTEWRVLLAFSRYGGLRVPSEVAGMQWEDLQPKRHRFTVRAAKTAHRAHLARRETPMFSEIIVELDRLRAERGPKATTGPVFQMKLTDSNLPSRFNRIVKAAGLKPWPKPFQNMRATRRTELQAEGHASHKLNCWFGHSQQVAEQSYLQVSDDDFAKAVDLAPQLAPSQCDLTEIKQTLNDMTADKLREIREFIDLLLSQE